MELKFLGFVVGNGKVLPDSDKISAITNFPRPIVKKDMRSFLGFINFYRKFVPNLASYVVPLNNTLCKGMPDRIVWTSELSDSFKRIVKVMDQSAPLYMPVKDETFVLQTDACDYGLGAALYQRVGTVDKPIAFISRRLSGAELNYAIIEKECLAIVWAIKRLHEYLYGKKFVVRTDHAPLQWLTHHKDLTSRRMRWALSLQSYDFSIEYIKGKENFVADVFSRYPSEVQN